MFWIDNFFDYGKCTDPYDDLIAHTVAYRSNDVTDWTAIGHTQNDNFGTKYLTQNKLFIHNPRIQYGVYS